MSTSPDPKDQAIEGLRLQLRLRDREVSLANDENDALRKEVARLKRENERKRTSTAEYEPEAASVEVVDEPSDPPRDSAPVRPFTSLPPARRGGLGGREPRLVQVLRAMGKPSTALEIADWSKITVESVYLSARAWSELVVHDGARPKRYWLRPHLLTTTPAKP